MDLTLGIVIGVVATLFVILVLPKLFFLVVYLFARTVGPGGCLVCELYPNWKVGERTNARYLAERFLHDLLRERRGWHRRAWRAHRWHPDNQERPLSDFPYAVECPGTDFFDQRGPYLTESAALSVAREHDRTCHHGETQTKVVALEERGKVSRAEKTSDAEHI